MNGSIAIIDIVLGLLILLFALFGWQRGAVKELFSIALLLIAFYIWEHYQQDIVSTIADFSGQAPQWLAIVSFALIFLCTLFLSIIIETLLRPLDTQKKEKILKTLGFVFGAYRLAILSKAVIWLLIYQPFKSGLIDTSKSLLYPVIKEIVPFLDNAPQLFF